MRLKLMFLPDPMNRISTDALSPGQSASAPMRRSLRFGLQGRLEDARNFTTAILRMASSARRNLPDTSNSLFTNAPTPQCGSATLDLQLTGDLEIRLSSRCLQNN